MNVLAHNIKKHREAKGMTQKQLADAIGKTKNVISNWENGLNKPDADTIELLLGIFGIDANTLLGWNNPEQIKRDAEELADKIISNTYISKALPNIAVMAEEEIQYNINTNKRITNKRITRILPLIKDLTDDDFELIINFIQRLTK